ncbi:hypothetical protein JXO59_15570 [candidate division KSB1 bacterium]|nr:hypothetical protein [candidate division KSB1 bacterium]
MKNLQIIPVTSRRDLKTFVHLPWRIYRNDPYWVPPLISEEYKMLDKKGTFHTFGEAQYFLAYQDGRPIGRISAHINHQYEKYHDRETGFFGFFECIDNADAASALFDAAADYLRRKNKKRILGPMSFCIYDISGVLYEGFDSSPVILLAYNPPYYNDLLTRAGFVKAIDWYAFLVNKDAPIRPALHRVKDRILRQKDLEIVPLNMKEYNERVRDVGHIFSDAWMENWGHVPLTEGQIQDLAKELKMVVVPQATYFAFYKGECVGFSLSIKDLNPAIKKANGRLFPFGLFKILLASRKVNRLRTIAMGVLKGHRHRGIDIAFYLKTIEDGTRLGFVDSECSIIVETNQRMIGALEDLAAERYKTYRFYEKKID